MHSYHRQIFTKCWIGNCGNLFFIFSAQTDGLKWSLFWFCPWRTSYVSRCTSERKSFQLSFNRMDFFQVATWRRKTTVRTQSGEQNILWANLRQGLLRSEQPASNPEKWTSKLARPSPATNVHLVLIAVFRWRNKQVQNQKRPMLSIMLATYWAHFNCSQSCFHSPRHVFQPHRPWSRQSRSLKLVVTLYSTLL